MNSTGITKAERAHMAAVKALPCSVCGAPGPSSAHHIKQGLHYCTASLCYSCHQDNNGGWHGDKSRWRLHKMDELDALNVTLAGVYGQRPREREYERPTKVLARRSK